MNRRFNPRDARRARIVVLATNGRSRVEIAERVGVSEPTVIKWRRALAREASADHAALTPISASWCKLAETFFVIITRQAIRRGSFASVDDLEAAIRANIDAYNQRCEPLTWTKTANEILAKLRP